MKIQPLDRDNKKLWKLMKQRCLKSSLFYEKNAEIHSRGIFALTTPYSARLIRFRAGFNGGNEELCSR